MPFAHPIGMIFSFVVITAALTVLSLPIVFSAILAATLVALAVRFVRDASALPLVSGSLILFCLVGEGVARVAVPISAIAYRPFALVETPEDHMKPNVNLENFRMTFGDIFVMSRFAFPSITETRVVNFRTDALGYRNDQPLQRGDRILVGDSFVVGNGEVDQHQTLSAQLAERLGRPVYNAGYPAGIPEYLQRIKRLAATGGVDEKSVGIVVFEGNDFPCNQDGNIRKYRTKLLFSPAIVWESRLHQIIYGLSRRALANLSAPVMETEVSVAAIGGKDVGFYNEYVRASRSSDICDWESLLADFDAVRPYVRFFAFVPTKYRVYKDHIHDPFPLYDTRWIFLRDFAERHDIPAVDLTPGLRQAADAALPEGTYVYFRDDTHWNAAGIAAAARVLAPYVADRPRDSNPLR